ncbi:MAG TPA: L-2-hydroxyglutarate oxidase [Solirubrobacteraceae bacterium]|nr:L-2-hydroxyglutarate oxidase [Solirubrobacteraceae bacterium]
MSASGDTCDLAIVGAGILGLATARELLDRKPDLRVCVVEREARVGMHQTAHNSGVVHAGIYYAPGSLKARLCVEGARELYAFCERHGIPVERCGKVIVARTPEELPGLDALEERGRRNGVPGLRRVDRAGLRELEPHAEGVGALHSPATGIVDFPAVARALAAQVVQRGGTLALGREVTGVDSGPTEVVLRTATGELTARHAVFCAGAWSDRLAVAAGAPPDPRIVPFRGAYLRLRPERRHLVRSLIYPVPDPALPFLGVHLTRHIGGDVLVGPTALMAGARDAYRVRRIRPHDLAATLAWPGTWRMARRWWRTGLAEMCYAASRTAFVHAAQRYLPDLRPDDVLPGPAGVRAQALGRDGALVDDFVISHTGRGLHVRNAPSPAATSSLAIARLIADRAQEAFDLPGQRPASLSSGSERAARSS